MCIRDSTHTHTHTHTHIYTAHTQNEVYTCTHITTQLTCTCTYRDVVNEDRVRHSKTMDSKHLKTYSSEGKLTKSVTVTEQLSKSSGGDVGVGPRSYSCSSKAFTFSTGKIRDVSLHGVSIFEYRNLTTSRVRFRLCWSQGQQ